MRLFCRYANDALVSQFQSSSQHVFVLLSSKLPLFNDLSRTNSISMFFFAQFFFYRQTISIDYSIFTDNHYSMAVMTIYSSLRIQLLNTFPFAHIHNTITHRERDWFIRALFYLATKRSLASIFLFEKKPHQITAKTRRQVNIMHRPFNINWCRHKKWKHVAMKFLIISKTLIGNYSKCM